MNEKHWEKYYQKEHTKEPSYFAQFCKEYFPNKSFVDIGAGNGRDTDFLNADGVDKFGSVKYRMDVLDFFKLKKKYDVAYARFFLHAVEENIENKLLHWAEHNTKYLAIETRSSHDNPKGHKRRLISINHLLEKIIYFGFEVEYVELNTGLAPTKDEDPSIIRVIARNEQTRNNTSES